jgi:hypothetical protein
MSLGNIAADLNSRGIVGNRDGKLHGMTVKKILENTIHQYGQLACKAMHTVGAELSKALFETIAKTATRCNRRGP